MTDAYLKYQNKGGKQKFFDEVTSWAGHYKMNINKAIIERMYKQLQAMREPINFHYGKAYEIAKT